MRIYKFNEQKIKSVTHIKISDLEIFGQMP